MEMSIRRLIHAVFGPFLDSIRLYGLGFVVVKLGAIKVIACTHLQEAIDLLAH